VSRPAPGRHHLAAEDEAEPGFRGRGAASRGPPPRRRPSRRRASQDRRPSGRSTSSADDSVPSSSRRALDDELSWRAVCGQWTSPGRPRRRRRGGSGSRRRVPSSGAAGRPLCVLRVGPRRARERRAREDDPLVRISESRPSGRGRSGSRCRRGATPRSGVRVSGKTRSTLRTELRASTRGKRSGAAAPPIFTRTARRARRPPFSTRTVKRADSFAKTSDGRRGRPSAAPRSGARRRPETTSAPRKTETACRGRCSRCSSPRSRRRASSG